MEGHEDSGALARLAVVQTVTESGLLALPPDEILQEVLERVRAGLFGATATILLRDQDGDGEDVLVVRASAGTQVEVAAGVRIPMGAGIAGRVAASREPVLVPDIANAGPVSDLLATTGQRSMVVVPLTVAGDVVGVLNVTSTSLDAFDSDDLSLLTMLGDQVALAVERIRQQDRERAAAAALRGSEERARAVLEAAVDSIITIDRSGSVESMNPAAERMFGYPAREVVGRNVSMLMPEPYRSRHDDYLARYHRTGERRIIGVGREIVAQRSDGSTFPVELTVSELGDELGLYTGVVRDITERKRFEAQLADRALHDPLTGVANRTLLMARLEHALERLPRRRTLLALLFVDLDRFKLVNDTLGHEMGDELLVETAARLRGALRAEDLVARVGGDEFVALCEDLSSVSEAETLAGRVVEALGAPQHLGGKELFVSASLGLTITDSASSTAAELLRDADTAMYQAKEQGRGRYLLFDDAMRARSSDRLHLGSELHHALSREELRACYQPVVSLETGEITGAEALLRWERPERGVLSPGDFLDVAVDNGLVVGFDAWMLETACRDAAAWGDQLGRPLGVWVNLSGRSLTDPNLLDHVGDALRRSSLDPSLLTLEIVEGALMHNAAASAVILVQLRELGVRLAVDDFGTGYSSLAYLQRFPVHALKIDRSFVSRVGSPGPEAAGSEAIVRAIVSLADGLGLRTVAEGVETPEQLATVTSLGCDLAQGFFLGRPAPEDRVRRAAGYGVLLPTTYATDQGA